MNIVYQEFGPFGGLEIPPDTDRIFSLPCFGNGYITKIVACQADEGPRADFLLQLFSARGPADRTNQSDSLGNEQGMVPFEMYQVTPELQAEGGVLAYYSEESSGGAGFGYQNQERDAVSRRSGYKREIYARVHNPLATAITVAIAFGGNARG